MEVLPPDVLLIGGGGGGGRRSSATSSPEFEFWMVRNPSFPQPNLLSADELFVDGVLLPLHHLPTTHPSSSSDPTPPPPSNDGSKPNVTEREPEQDRSAPSTATDPSPAAICYAPVSSSKRWKDIFRGVAGEKKPGEKKPEEKEERQHRRERKASGPAGSGATELNINIWPFSRSRSAGGARSKPSAASGRKVSSAPCSRSNSRGESSRPPVAASSARRWAGSPARAGGGVHVGRASPVLQLHRKERKAAEQPKSGDSGGGVELACIGYRSQARCRGDGKQVVTAGERTAGGNSNASSSHFNLRALFSRKVY